MLLHSLNGCSIPWKICQMAIDSGSVQSMRREQQRFIENSNRIALQDRFICDEHKNSFIGWGRFGNFEGLSINKGYLQIGLSIGAETNLFYRSDKTSFEGILRPGDLSVILPDTVAETVSTPMEVLGLFVDLAQFDSAIFGRRSAEDFRMAASEVTREPVVASVMHAMWQTAQVRGLNSPFFYEGVDIILEQLSNPANKRRVHFRELNKKEARLERAKAFVHENLDRSISVADMAAEAGIEHSQFFAAFREATGITPYAYLTQCRMDRAREMLLDGVSITEAAAAVGYANPSKFAAAFRRHAGQSPTQWLSGHNRIA